MFSTAALHPLHSQKLAIDDGISRLTYQDLSHAAGAVAVSLQESGIRPGDRVLIFSKGYAATFTSLLAIWSIGATAVPLNLASLEGALPLIRALSPRLMLCDGEAVPNLGIEHLSIDRASQRPAEPIGLKNEASVILFTSGSSGAPKGAFLPASSIIGNAERTAKALRLTGNDRILINTPPYYTSAIVHFLTLLSVGGGMVARSGFQFGSSLWELLRTHDCTGYGGAPANLTRLFDAEVPQTLPPHFRFVVSSGDHLSADFITRVLNRFPELEIFTLYGLTEVGGRLCVLDSKQLPRLAGSVGKPILDMRVTVRQTDGQPSGAGQIGEIYVEGPLIMQSYVGDSGATREALTDDGFRTGDFGYVDEAGFLWLVGRMDDVFKSGAEKVSTSLIAARLSSSESISDIAIVAADDVFLGRVPHAYVVPGNSFDLDAFKKFARNVLPRNHMPKKWILVKEIPRTGSGKVRKQELVKMTDIART